MLRAVEILVHSSQFPDRQRRELIRCLRARKLNPKFLYESLRQTRKWLALHEACSPARTDPDCVRIYRASFAEAARRITGRNVDVVGLGAGGGWKEARLLKVLAARSRALSYTPVDVGAAMVLTAVGAARHFVPQECCFPLVCDLASEDDPSEFINESRPRRAVRLITCFGVLPNLEPAVILPRLAGLLQPGDWLLVSANLVPGRDYAAGVKLVLPQYDNEPTRDWLMAFLLDLGVGENDGRIEFRIEDDRQSGLKRIAAWFRVGRSIRLALERELIEFRAGDQIRLFVSHRHTPARLESLLNKHGIGVLQQWVTRSDEEGVFLAQKAARV
jgi:uncharacterized SAM-dependent methyltransferase